MQVIVHVIVLLNCIFQVDRYGTFKGKSLDQNSLEQEPRGDEFLLYLGKEEAYVATNKAKTPYTS